MKPKKIKLWSVFIIILVIYISTIAYYFWEAENRGALSADVNDFSFCEAGEKSQKVSIIGDDELELAGGISLCGHLTTDGHSAYMHISVFLESDGKFLYRIPRRSRYEPGFVKEFIPAQIISKPGLYSARVYFQRGILATAQLHVIEAP